MVASSDETVTPLLAPILYDLSLIDWNCDFKQIKLFIISKLI